MDCSWSLICNPGALLRAVWNFTVTCWNRLRDFFRRITTPQNAPTLERMEAFNRQSPGMVDTIQRQVSTEARQGSISSPSSDMRTSMLSTTEPSEAVSVPASGSQISPNETFDSSSPEHIVPQAPPNSPPTSNGEQNSSDSEKMLKNDQGSESSQEIPLVRRRGSQQLLDASTPVSDSSDRSYKTF